MSAEPWKLWQRPRLAMSESFLLRYGVAVILPIASASVIFVRPVFSESPFFAFLAAVVLSAVYGGLAPAFVSIAWSALLLRVLFVHPNGSLQYRADLAGMERMAGFVLVAALLSSFVAALRRDRNQLRDSEARYRMLAETASDAILVIDDRGEILYVNPVAEKMFGSGASHLLGRNLAVLLPGNGYQTQLKEMKRHLDSRRKAVAVQMPGLHQSGERLLVEMTLGTSRHRGRDLFTAIIRDVTGCPR
jgi:PAS domain S-box-containing protein